MKKPKILHKKSIIACNFIPVVKGDKRLDPTALFGIWAENPRSLESIRKNGWEGKTAHN